MLVPWPYSAIVPSGSLGMIEREKELSYLA